MRLRSRCLGSWLPVLTVIAGIGCGTGNNATAQIEVLNWWKAQGEERAFEALIAEFSNKHPGLRVKNSSLADDPKERTAVLERMRNNDLVESFQTLVGRRLEDWIPLLDPFDKYDGVSFNWEDMFNKRIHSFSPNESSDGTGPHHYCVPIDLQRENCLFYNEAILSALGQNPPTKWDDFFALAEKLKKEHADDSDFEVLALDAADDWGASLLFQSVMLAATGPDYYRDFFRGEKDPSDEEFRSALRLFLRVLDYADRDAGAVDWNGATEKLKRRKAAMFIHGDWVVGSLGEDGREIGEAVAPGTADYFVFSSDCFPLSKALGNEQRLNALKFLATVGSPEGQAIFNSEKGSLPALRTVSAERFGVLQRKRLDIAQHMNDEQFVESSSTLMTYYMGDLLQKLIAKSRHNYVLSDRSDDAKSSAVEDTVSTISSIYSGFARSAGADTVSTSSNTGSAGHGGSPPPK